MSTKPKTDRDNIIEEPEYTNPPLTPEQKTQSLILGGIGWLIPGAAHFKLGDFKRAILFFCLIERAVSLGHGAAGRNRISRP